MHVTGFRVRRFAAPRNDDSKTRAPTCARFFIRLPGRPVADGWGFKTSNRSKGAGQLMITIVLIALAAGSASALMFASTISGALISLLLFYLAPLPLMMAALGWGPLECHDRRHRRGMRSRRDFRAALLYRLCAYGRAAGVVAGPSRIAGAPCRHKRIRRQRRGAGCPRHGMVPGRPHPALDRRLCHADHHGGAAHARHRCRDH